MGFQRFEDQDGDAAYAGYTRMREQVRERASEEERTRRIVAMRLFDDLKAMMFDFAIGKPVDAHQFGLKADQIALNIEAALELRSAAQAAKSPTRELAAV